MPDIRRQLLAAFDLEHREHLQAIRQAIAAGGEADAREIFRRAHSLKGAARAVDLPVVEEQAHALESLCAELMDGARMLDAATAATLEGLLDAVEDAAAAAYAPPAPKPAETTAAAPAPEEAVELVRIDVEAVAGLSRAMQTLSGDVLDHGAIDEDLRRLASDARKLERRWRDARSAAGRVREVEQGLKDLSRALNELSVRRVRAGWALDQGLSDLRGRVEEISQAPAETVFGGFSSMVRDIAREAGVPVDVRVSGLETRADRRVLQALKDPVMHLLRNAVSHGREAPEARAAAGKPDRLTVVMAVSAASGRLRIEIADDGPGPDLARLEAAAVDKGLMQPRPEGAPAPTPEELLAHAFAPGVSTAQGIDRLAGRGMGLSVVAEAVRKLRGELRLTAGRPWGARVVLSTPLSAARQSLLFVDIQGRQAALPSLGVRRLLRLDATTLETVEGHPAARIAIDGDDVIVPMVPLSALLTGVAAEVPVHAGAVSAVLLSHGRRHVAMAVDALCDVRSALVEDLDADDLDADLIAGAVQLDDQAPALALDPDALVRRWLRDQRHLAAGGLGFAESADDADETARTILVVDDSITTRTLEKSILEAQGYRVLLAVDGLDALNLLRSGQAIIDLVVADIEMPRMDGFSLLQAVKADAALAATPVILMTSRADAADVRRGLDLGAEAYITKQKFDQRELLAAIGQLL
ncbi:hybrid sensor histidine kinase/response regulator [Caulobacter endophyticus]|uniref:Chemotaxis protein CheA n=1 Tax=Caulobacter endophyticus TaxID=2172652 RepID=A0A2T9JV10_9CAUL|nr:response regulator [Caulobacter endophyticus]PVM87381.1 hybrid sensor histidine kinase/response regulator [Caulobacter endophyticus]